jgi:hypothetical protein
MFHLRGHGMHMMGMIATKVMNESDNILHNSNFL